MEELLKKGLALMDENKDEEALPYLERVYKNSPINFRVPRVNLGILHTRLARNRLEAKTRDPEGAWYHAWLALHYAYDDEDVWLEMCFVSFELQKNRLALPAVRMAVMAHKGIWIKLTQAMIVMLTTLGLYSEVVDQIYNVGVLVSSAEMSWPPDFAAAVAVSLQFCARYAKAADLLIKKVTAHNANTVNLLTGLAFDCGEIDAALGYHLQTWDALVSKSSKTLLCNGVNRVFTTNYSTTLTEEEIFGIHRQWGDALASCFPLCSAISATCPNLKSHVNVGYIGSDFREHAVSCFASCLYTLFDQSKFKVFIYDSSPYNSEENQDDFVSTAMKHVVSGYHNICGLEAADAAALIAKDEIDILVDLAGHTSGTRLDVLLHRNISGVKKQITMIGYPNTTGLPEGVVNYRVVDWVTDIPNISDKYHTEKLLRVTGCFLCFNPNVLYRNIPAIRSRPSSSKPFTFGCFAKLPKISDRTMAAWVKILRETTNSVLCLKTKIFADKDFLELFKEKLLQTHFNGDQELLARVQCLPYRNRPDQHLEDYNTLDCVLDTFPYSGTTTTCEALLMGVPVITLYGTTHRQNVSTSIITHACLFSPLSEICHSEDEYVKTAVRFAHTVLPNEEYKTRIRETFLGSPVCANPKEYVKKIEDQVFLS